MKKNNVRRFYGLLRRIRQYGERMALLTDEELAGLTGQFRERLHKGETLDQLLPEAFAAICEADSRVLHKTPYDVQILGGIALHKGYLAEMNTGEGKTLTATLPLYLNALTGKGAILVTANDYLAMRDAEEMGPVYRFMGMTVAAGVRSASEDPFTTTEKQQVYAADIVYTTHGILGFDYLLNNLVTRAEDQFLRKFYYVIIDEADSVLLDGAQTPLVISGAPRVQSNLYKLADLFVNTLEKDRDYETEDKAVWLTEEGIRYAEQFFQINNFYGEEFFEFNRHVTLALRAHVLFENRKDYMVLAKGELVLLDGGSGRLMNGVKLRGGQHQALEIKEKLPISQETRSMASITYQNLFRLFEKMSGMSGTLADASQELQDVYGKKVLVIPPNKPLRRRDLKDVYFRNTEMQIRAAVKTIRKVHATGQPVLIVVATIPQTEMISQLLMEYEIPHNVLNANNAFWEADIIREAGQKNAVTVSTSMAGRGTDIKLGKGVGRLGGLAVIGVGRMGNIRQERQARGRAGRQGDPGVSRFFVSLQDDLVLNSGMARIEKYAEGKKRISKRKMRKLINSAQSLGEEYAAAGRKQAMNYDLVLKRQRELMYEIREDLLHGTEFGKEKFMEIAGKNIRAFVKNCPSLGTGEINRYILDHISYRLDPEALKSFGENRKEAEEYLCERADRGFEEQKKKLGSLVMEEFLRRCTLRAVDEAWIEQVDYLQQLQTAVSGRNTAQRNPLFEYQREAAESFQRMETTILQNIMRNVLLSSAYMEKEQKLYILFP